MRILNVIVCVEAASCSITNVVQQCKPENLAARFGFAADGFSAAKPFAVPLAGWTLVWSSTGIAREWPASVPADTELAMVIERNSDKVRYRISYRISQDLVRILSVALFTDPIPRYGASVHCKAAPATFNTAKVIGNRDVYVRFCLEPFACFLNGDVESTPEIEPCSVSGYRYEFTLGYDKTAAKSWANSGSPVESASGGTVGTDQRTVTGMPVDTDVTFVLNDTHRIWTIVARWTGAGYIVQSVAVKTKT
jgi:hypothetical protein